MNWYARFYEDLKDNDGNILYHKDTKKHKTRYAIMDEDEEHYYIALKPNDTEYNSVSIFKKSDENKVYFLMEE